MNSTAVYNKRKEAAGYTKWSSNVYKCNYDMHARAYNVHAVRCESMNRQSLGEWDAVQHGRETGSKKSWGYAWTLERWRIVIDTGMECCSRPWDWKGNRQWQ